MRDFVGETCGGAGGGAGGVFAGDGRERGFALAYEVAFACGVLDDEGGAPMGGVEHRGGEKFEGGGLKDASFVALGPALAFGGSVKADPGHGGEDGDFSAADGSEGYDAREGSRVDGPDPADAGEDLRFSRVRRVGFHGVRIQCVFELLYAFFARSRLRYRSRWRW